MKRRITAAVASIAAGVAWSFGSAVLAAGPDRLLVEKLAPEIRKACIAASGSDAERPAGADGLISAAALAKALDASDVAPLKFRYGEAMTPEAVASRAFPAEGTPSDPTLLLLRRLVITSIDPRQGAADYLPLEAGGFRVSSRTGQSQASDAQAVLVDILRGDDSRFLFHCRTDPVPRPPPERADGSITWTVAKSSADFGKALKERPFAEAAMVFDEVSGGESYTIHGAVGATFAEHVFDSGSRIAPAAYLQFDREGSNTSNTEVNNLILGVQARGLLIVGPETATNPRRVHAYSLDLRYQTDDDFDSRVWTASASFTPQLGPRKSGNIVPVDLIEDRLQFGWSLSAVADWSWVDDPGAKAELAGKGEFGRIGADLDARLAWTPGGDPTGLRVSLAGTYQVREDLTDNGADAEMFTARLLIEPTANFAFGLAYDRGENLDSLKFSEQWRLTFGIRY